MTLNRFEIHKCHKWWKYPYLKVVNNDEITCISKALCSTNYGSKNLYANCPKQQAVARCSVVFPSHAV